MTPNQLKEILAQHVLWLDSDGEQGRQADLWEADLTRANLWVANLSRADLHGADLRGASLIRANLDGAYLRGAYLMEADLTAADLTGAKLGPEIRECWTFERAKVSEDQLAWLCLHPGFGEWVSGLVIV